MNFINIPYQIPQKRDFRKKDIKKLLLQRVSPRITGSNRLRSYYYITKVPHTEDAVEFGFPQFRKWFLQITYSGFLKVYYTQSDFTSVMHVLIFNFCGLVIKNLNELIKESEERKLYYLRKLSKTVENKSQTDNTNELALDDDKYVEQNGDNSLPELKTDKYTHRVLPTIIVNNETSWNHVIFKDISLYEFCKYIEYVLGENVVRLLRIPIQQAFDRARIHLYSYKYIQKDLNHLLLSLCPSLHDILTYISFCDYVTKTSDDNDKNLS
ncbi:HzNVorf93-like protein [Microplitis demolitor]|nr:HzNVorf93-like protein [Microplitis demolitor]